MKEIINNRVVELVEYNTTKNWCNEIPAENWLCVLVVDDKPRRYIDEVISKIINRNVCYLCAIGNQSKEVHDLMDEETEFREVDIEQLYLPEHDIVTTWYNDYEEGIRFAIFAAFHKLVKIKQITILDMTDGRDSTRIQSALLKIKNEV